jgi:hypothetical protein
VSYANLATVKKVSLVFIVYQNKLLSLSGNIIRIIKNI